MRSRDRLDIWWQRFGSSPPAGESALVGELSRRGVDCHPLPDLSAVSSGPGLLVFDGCNPGLDPGLADSVRDLSRRGEERLIAVALHREALARGSGWQLLQAGASDVLAATDPAETA